jgi:pimeloyl-ACP methyl ester carboxylesterase
VLIGTLLMLMVPHLAGATTDPGGPRNAYQMGLTGVAVAMMIVGVGVIVVTPGHPVAALLRLVVVAGAGLGLVVLRRRARPGLVAVILAALGAAAGVSGAAIAVPHMLTDGLSVRAAGSAVAAVGGLLALGCATVMFVRTVSGWRRLLALPVIVVVGYLGYLPLGMAVYATNPPRVALGSATPDVYGLTYRDVSFASADGVLLSGWYIPSANQAALVLLPGSGSTRSSVLNHAVVLARHGYGILLFDPRGHGRSGGRAMDFGWFGEQDITAAVTYLRQQPKLDPDRIGVLGLSMGGEEAIGALAADRRIRAAVAEGATHRVLADKAWLPEVYGIRGRIQLGVDAVAYGLADLFTGAHPPMSLGDAVVAAAPRPVLLIAGGDALDEENADTRIAARSPATVHLWVVPHAGHVAALSVSPAEWDAHVTEFLAVALA